MHGPGEAGCLILSQSEDQSRPHPVLSFVHPMSTQVRGLGPNAAESAHRPDPQIATRTRIRASRQAANYPENCIKLLGPVPGEYGRRLHHPNPCQETPRTPFLGCFNGLVATALVGQAGARVLARQLADRVGVAGAWCASAEGRWAAGRRVWAGAWCASAGGGRRRARP